MKAFLKYTFIFLLALVLLKFETVFANEEPRFSAYRPNFIIVSAADNDETGLQVRLSAKYRMFECAKSKDRNVLISGICKPATTPFLRNTFGDLNVYVSYTTDFDFYVFSDGEGYLERDSRPVRNRMTSPALHFDLKRIGTIPDSGFWWNSSSVSVVHHSNGQDMEFDSEFVPGVSTDEDIISGIDELDKARPSWMDGVSRGWNYFEFKMTAYAGERLGNCIDYAKCASISIAYKLPIPGTRIADTIWWEPGNDSGYRDYNILVVNLNNKWKRGNLGRELDLDFKCGSKSCSVDALVRADTYIGDLRLPVMYYAHLGPNEHFYNYHEDATSFGIGLHFSP